MVASINSRVFGELPTGETVEAWTLCGTNGLELEAITYGGIVTRLLVPDRDGVKVDVILGFDSLEQYLAGHPYFGAIIGRVAGRIAAGTLSLDGNTHKLSENDGPNHLHGGVLGFDKKLWKAKRVTRSDGSPSLCLTASSAHGEEGYPGNLIVNVTYTVTNDNGFLIEIDAVTDRLTPVSLTHHCYFNLAGEGSGPVDHHELQVYADQFVPTDPTMLALGRLEHVIQWQNDLREPHELGDVIPGLYQYHGDLYRLRKPLTAVQKDEPVVAARLTHKGSGRVMTVITNEAYLQVYTAAHLDGSLTGKSGVSYGPYAGLCLECEGYPNGVSTPEMGDIILRPGQTLRRSTAYAFTTTGQRND